MTNETPPTSNTEIETKATELLRRQYYEVWAAEDDMRLSEWLSESPRHLAAYWRLKAAWEQTERLAALRAHPFWRPATQKTGSLSKFAKAIVAAAVVAAVAVTASFWDGPSGSRYATGVGGRTTIRLADGSELDLGTDTEIRTHFTSGRRAVDVLKGEVFFRITHNEAQPFVVTAGKHRVIDLGTEFLVRTSYRKFQVALIQGEAKVETTDMWSPPRSVTLHPGDVALATSNSLEVNRKSSRELSDELAWRRGVLVFHNTRLADAVAEFNRYNETKLVVSGPKTAELTINGTFRTNGFEQFARVTRDVFGLRVERRAEEIVLEN